MRFYNDELFYLNYICSTIGVYSCGNMYKYLIIFSLYPLMHKKYETTTQYLVCLLEAFRVVWLNL